MKPYTLLISTLLIALLSACSTTSAPTSPQSQTAVSTKVPTRPVTKVLVALKGEYKLEGELDEASVKLQRNAIAEAQTRVIEAIKAESGTKPNPDAPARLKRRYITVPGLALELKPELVKVLEALPDVAGVFPDELNRPMLEGTTQIIGSHLANPSQLGVDGQGQVVAVLDSGIDRNHPFLGTSRFVANACFSNNSWFSNDEQTLCPNGEDQQFGDSSGENCTGIAGCNHGTHVAGIVGGFRDENGNGAVDLNERKGVAPRVRFIAMQIFTRINNSMICDDDPIPCIRTSNSDIIAGLDRVEVLRDDHPIAAVNLSVGGGKHTSNCDWNLPLKWAIDNLRSRKTATVVAAGNDGYSDALSSPACISSAISVGNTRNDDMVNDNSNTSSFLKLLAPGTNVNSSVPGSGFDDMTGTSMAAPHVAGLWALMKQHRSTNGQSTSVGPILNRLSDTGVNITENGVTTPRVDAMRALGLGAVEIRTTFNVINLSNAQPVTRTFTLDRRNFAGELNLLPTLESGNPQDLSISFNSNPTTANSVSMTITPALFANGSYTLNLGGAANQVGVFGKRLTLNVVPPAPVVSSLSPTSGPPTTWVTISGQNFSRLTEVQFVGGTRIRPTVDSSTSIRVRVPAGAQTGSLRVYNANLMTNSANFTVTAVPVITSVSPSHAPVGARVSVSGANFDASTTVRINNVLVSNLSITSTQLSFNVPQTTNGVHQLRASSAGSDTTSFTVGHPVPNLLSFSPQNGRPGDTITLSGSGFFAPVSVRICNRFTSVTVVGSSQLQVVVPQGIGDSCSVLVTTPGGSDTANQNFQNAQ